MANWRGAADARLGIVDWALDLVDDVDVAFFRLGGGLQSLRLCAGVICGGDGDRDDAGLGPWTRRLTDADRKKAGADIACADWKE